MTNSKEPWIDVSAVEVIQPVGTFFVGSIDGKILAEIAFSDERRLEAQDRRDRFAEYLGIQRPLNKKRIPEIRDFVQAHDASFPSTIILAMSGEDVRWDGKKLQVRNAPDTATILDGQHRLAGLREAKVDRFDLPVTIFVDMTMEMQAHVFSTINTKQTRINPSLAKDLLTFSSIDTPEKVVHHIARGLNADEGGPFYGVIKMLGVREVGSEAILTQHTFVEHVVSLIYNSDHHNSLRLELQKCRNKRSKLPADQYPPDRFPLYELYRQGDDSTIFTIISNYFTSIKKAFPNDWANPNSILSKTTGFHALVIALRPLIVEGIRANNLSTRFFQEFASNAKHRLDSINLTLTANEFGLGSAAAKRLAETLMGQAEASS